MIIYGCACKHVWCAYVPMSTYDCVCKHVWYTYDCASTYGCTYARMVYVWLCTLAHMIACNCTCKHMMCLCARKCMWCTYDCAYKHKWYTCDYAYKHIDVGGDAPAWKQGIPLREAKWRLIVKGRLVSRGTHTYLCCSYFYKDVFMWNLFHVMYEQVIIS